VSDPTNPQCLNRYSYCLNNPLKYTDPSGHEIGEGIEGAPRDGDMGWTIKDGYIVYYGGSWHCVNGDGSGDNKLLAAYYLAIWADPSLKGYFNPNHLGWASQGGGGVTLGGSTPVFGYDSLQETLNFISSNLQYILMSPDYKNADINLLAAAVAHELYHAKEGRFSDSIQEEVGAYTTEYKVGCFLGIENDPNIQFAKQFADCLPTSDNQLRDAKNILKRVGGSTGGMYGSLPLYPSTNAYIEWNTLFGMVKGLIVGSK
jgi:hypothetical protein